MGFAANIALGLSATYVLLMRIMSMVLGIKIMIMSKVMMTTIMSTEMMVSIIVFVVVFLYQLKGMQNCASDYLEIIWIIKKRS